MIGTSMISKSPLFYLYNPCGFDEVDSVRVVFLHPGPYGQDVGVEDDIIGVKAHLFG